jgi:retron-type reverse transcriptase
VLSPILSNIYLNELDKFVENLMLEFNKERNENVTKNIEVLQIYEVQRIKHTLKK